MDDIAKLMEIFDIKDRKIVVELAGVLNTYINRRVGFTQEMVDEYKAKIAGEETEKMARLRRHAEKQEELLDLQIEYLKIQIRQEVEGEDWKA